MEFFILEIFIILTIINMQQNQIYINTKPIKYDEYLEMKAFKLDTIARIDSQPLPAVKKLPKFA